MLSWSGDTGLNLQRAHLLWSGQKNIRRPENGAERRINFLRRRVNLFYVRDFSTRPP